MPPFDGDAADNTLAGGPSADTISGGLGSDTLSGGGGADVIYGFGSADVAPDSGRIDVHQFQHGFDTPVFAGSAPGDPNRLYVVEITGQIQIVDLVTEQVAATPFLAIPHSELGSGGERGLLGLAFAPDYATSGKFYVDRVNPAGDIQIVQYTRSATNPSVADPASAKLILSIPHPTNQHYAGWIGFGPDGDLYISTGDGDAGQVPSNPAQDPNSLLGKMLRIDVTRDDFPNDPSRNYAIPAGNPFVGGAGAPEVYALGLRNPWRDSFDTATGRLYIGDVGEGAREEIDVISPGAGGLNFGWTPKEGTLGPANGAFTDPVLEYNHGRGPLEGDSVTGGYVYHGPGGLQGLYVFGDFIDGNLFAARMSGGQASGFQNLNSALRYDGPAQIGLTTSFGVDGQGRLYAVTVDGHLFRISPSEAAGDGNDSIAGGDGDDQLYGGAGDDALATGAGRDSVSGGLGADTVAAGQDSNQLAGGAGADVFVFAALPWNAGHVTDFTVGQDKLDVWALLRASGYSGSDPVADGYVTFTSDGAGGTRVDVDGDGRGAGAPIRVTNLDGVTPGGLTSAQVLTTSASPPPPPPPPPPPSGGRVITADDSPGQALTGGDGNDTLNAGHNSVVETGGGGADAFAFGAIPWNAGHITDFTVGTDRIDLSQLFAASGYSGADPIADGYVILASDGSGGTNVFYDTDGRASGNTIQFKITDLDHVAPTGRTWGQLSGSFSNPPPPPPASDGRVITADDSPGQALTGGTGNDTLNAGHNSVVETGAGGADAFAFGAIPWNAGHVTDFMVGTDRLDLSQLFAASGYGGANPIADGYVILQADGAGGTNVFYDTDGRASGNTIQFKITDLDHVSPSGLTWAQLTGSGSPPPPPPPSVAGFETTLVSHPEGNSGATAFEYVVSRTNTDQPLTLFWAVSGTGDHPAGPQDFTGGNLPNAYLQFAAGQARASFVVSIAGDTEVEPDEGFTVSLSDNTGQIFTRAAGAIQSDDTSAPGQVINSQQYGDTLVGGSGNDTLNAGRGPDVLTGANGADHFAWAELPWNPGHVTDFATGVDVLDLRALFAAAGYHGSDPIADGYLQFVNGNNGTAVKFDPDGPGQGVVYPYTITNLDHVSPGSITPQDWLFR